jgi:hypothetical protein
MQLLRTRFARKPLAVGGEALYELDERRGYRLK